MGKKITKRSVLFHEYYSRLKCIAVSAFKWEGLPETCNARFLENTLFHYGQAIFIKDKTKGFLNLKVAPNGDLNVYNEPLFFNAFSTGYSEDVSADDSVFIFNNALKKSTESTVILYAERLAKIQECIDINLDAQKTPILIRCDKKTQLSLERLYGQYSGGKPVIYGSEKGLTGNPLEVLLTGAPFLADKLREEQRAVWNEALEFLGFNTNPTDKKKERVIIAEVESNNEQIDIQALTMLSERKEACRLINEKYGLAVNVSQRVDELKRLWTPTEPEQETDSEGDNYGEIYH